MPEMVALAKCVRDPRQLTTRLLAIALFLSFLESPTGQSTLRAGMEPVPSVGDEATDAFLDDRSTLLQFKNGLANRGEPCLSSWNEVNVTRWTGVTWTTDSGGSMVVERLELTDCGLTGKTLYPLLERGLRQLRVLHISGNNFTGTFLPEALRICESLVVLDLSNNSIAGSLPLNLSCENSESWGEILAPSAATAVSNTSGGRYSYLKIFNLSSNGFTGSLPQALLESMASVWDLDVSHNRLTGSLPSLVGHLYKLRSLALEGNYFTGSIPEFSDHCTRLTQLKLSNNSFTGLIPFRALGVLHGLEELDVSFNNLTGGLDVGIGRFESLRMFNAANNSLDGVLPPQIGNISTLQVLRLAYNNFSGALPAQIGNVSTLQVLSLKHNNFIGGIPASLSACSELTRLELQYNYLGGTIPSEVSKLGKLSTLSLNSNRLTGQIPSSISNCSRLRALWLGENHLEGSIPPQLGNLTDLVVLSLYGNYYKSAIPPDIGRLTNLVALDLERSQMTGVIPVSVCNLLHLQVFFINNNDLSGELPYCIFNYSFIRLLDFSFNRISGSLPSSVANRTSGTPEGFPDELTTSFYFTKIQGHSLNYEYGYAPMSVALHANDLSGHIPGSLANWEILQQLILSNNSFSGEIPASLGSLSQLLYLDISFNSLTGRIPFELTKLHFLSVLNLSFNELEGRIPTGGQFSTFKNSSFLGNPGLCGGGFGGLTKECEGSDDPASALAANDIGVDGTILSIPDLAFTFGCGFVFGFFAMGSAFIFVGRLRYYVLVAVLVFYPGPKVRNFRRRYGLFTDDIP